MKFLITFILCFFFNSFETAAIYEVGSQGISTTFPIVVTPKKLSFKERVALKYLQLKAAKSKKKTRFFIAAVVFLFLGVFLTFSARQTNQASPPNGFTGSNEGCLKAVLALVSYATSLVLFIVALVTSV
jgi:hypothetical protein